MSMARGGQLGFTHPFRTQLTWNAQLQKNGDAQHTLLVTMNNVGTAVHTPLGRIPSITLPEGDTDDWNVGVAERPNLSFDPWWGHNKATHSWDISLDYLHRAVPDLQTYTLRLSFIERRAVRPFGRNKLYRLFGRTNAAMNCTRAMLTVSAPKVNIFGRPFLWVVAKLGRKSDIYDLYHVSWAGPTQAVYIQSVQGNSMEFRVNESNPDGLVIYQRVGLRNAVVFPVSLVSGIAIGVAGNAAYAWLTR